MPYTPYYDPAGWKDDPDTTTPLKAAALNYIEAGIKTAQAAAEAAGGDVTTDAVWNAKGDLVVGSGSDAASRLGVGSNAQVLTADSAQSLGVKWATPATPTPPVIPVSLTTPRASSLAGNSFWTVAGMTDWDMGHWEFVKDVDGKVYGTVLVPSGATTATLRLAIAANATSGVTRLNVGYAPIADAESLNPASLTDGTAQDITVPATAYLRKDVTFSLTGLAGADLVIVEIFHEGSHANDTLAVNTLLLGAWLEAA